MSTILTTPNFLQMSYLEVASCLEAVYTAVETSADANPVLFQAVDGFLDAFYQGDRRKAKAYCKLLHGLGDDFPKSALSLFESPTRISQRVQRGLGVSVHPAAGRVIDDLPGGKHPERIRPRPYQTEAAGKVMQSVVKEGEMRHLIVLPTGTGKTVVKAHIMHHLWGYGPYRDAIVLDLSPREELVKQTAGTFRRVFGEKVKVSTITRGEEKDFDANVIVMTVQAALNPKNMNAVLRQARGRKLVLFLDEAHHFVLKNSWGFAPLTTLGIFDEKGHYNPANDIVMVGLTATVDRTDGVPLSTIYGFDKKGRPNLRFSRPLSWFIRNGYLVTPRGYLVETALPSLRGIKKGPEGDYDREELSRKMRAMKTIQAAVDAYFRIAYDPKKNKLLKGYIYCVDVEHAKAMADAMQKEMTKRGLAEEAAYVTYKVEEEFGTGSREAILEGSRDGDIAALANVSILTEGIDDPNVVVALVARPTTSRLWYEQVVGRILRPPDPKNPKDHSRKRRAIVIDITSNIQDHVIDLDRMDLARLFGREYGGEVYEPKFVEEGERQPEVGRQRQVVLLGIRGVELIHVGRSFGPHLQLLISGRWEKDEIPVVPAYKAGILTALLVRYMQGVEIPKKKPQVTALADALEFSDKEKGELVHVWANDMADKRSIEATSGRVGAFSPGASGNRPATLPPELVPLIENFEQNGILPNVSRFASLLKDAGFLREAQALNNSARFSKKDQEISLRNAIRKLRELKLLSPRGVLPGRASFVLAEGDSSKGRKRTAPPPNWSRFGIKGPRDGLSLTEEGRLGWFVDFLSLVEHDGNLNEAMAASGLAARTLGEIRGGNLPRDVQPERIKYIREKLIPWAGRNNAKFTPLITLLFDDFVAARLGWEPLPEEEGWKKSLQSAARSWLIVQYGGLPPKELRHRYQAIINIATGRVDWTQAKRRPDFKEVVLSISSQVMPEGESKEFSRQFKS